jgi:hypothetical protein
MPRRVTWHTYGEPEGIRLWSDGYGRGVEVVQQSAGPSVLWRAFEVCRRQIIAELLGRDLHCDNLESPLRELVVGA